VTGSDTIPMASSPALVTPEWLTRALALAGIGDGERITSLRSEAVGTGQMGENIRFHLNWSDRRDRLPTVVGKFPSDDPVSRATGLATRSYEREVLFYRHIADTVEIRTPRCYHGAVDSESGDFVLILEDLAPRRQGDQLSGCKPADATAAIDQLVALQAPRWNDPTLCEVEWLSRRDAETVTNTAMLYHMVLPGFVATVGSLITPDHVRVAQQLGECIERWLDTPDGPRVVTHGDYRLDNLLFDDDVGLAVVDWQGPGHGSPWHDLAYFLGTGLLPSDREVHEDDLVRRHHAGLVAAGVDVAWDEVWSGYRRAAFGGLLMAVVASQIVVATDRGNQMFAAMAQRSAAMALHHGTLDLI